MNQSPYVAPFAYIDPGVPIIVPILYISPTEIKNTRNAPKEPPAVITSPISELTAPFFESIAITREAINIIQKITNAAIIFSPPRFLQLQ